MKKIFMMVAAGLFVIPLQAMYDGRSFNPNSATIMEIKKFNEDAYGDNIHHALHYYHFHTEKEEVAFLEYLNGVWHHINEKTYNGNTPIMAAVRDSHSYNIIVRLIELGAEVNARNCMNLTALMYAAQQVSFGNSSTKVIECLLRNGADTSAVSCMGSTALSIAGWGNIKDGAKVLYNHIMRKHVSLKLWAKKNPETLLGGLPRELVNIIAIYAYGLYKE